MPKFGRNPGTEFMTGVARFSGWYVFYGFAIAINIVVAGGAGERWIVFMW